ncbi:MULTISPECIES: NAD-dependent epimerase/dehydratase family protein [unclassified Rhodococcus (in: high G+C Gram-positive bacteria)]|uniref:NAD-dependent epimerase/dehydratase family protein n=1 Tax=unclassified Rhodococcus (in: high G+C Gram-positive bacteria) TaxID=192944 RepID=UPI00211C56F6|nr:MULTISPECIES: NAD-dependent epimerase/dehydratase family protein [unclassified Rhodococcus (in: high G+C Gram-positive bacteria)]
MADPVRALVTGASGFLGGALARRLVADGEMDVSVLVRRSSNLTDLGDTSKLTLVYGDLTDRDSLFEATRGVDVVFHSAARVDERGVREQFWKENVQATVDLLEASHRNGVSRFVFISSPSALMEYDGGDQIDVDESVPYPSRYLNLYSETKAAAERLVLEANGPDLITCALRPRAIWGAGDRSGPIVRLLAKASEGSLPDISGGKDVYASLCHVDNIVDACVRAAGSDQVGGRPYYIADAETTNVWEFVGVVSRMFGFAPPSRRPNPRVLAAVVTIAEAIWRVPYIAKRWSPPLSRYVIALMTRSATFDTGAARRDLGYRPVVDRDKGLAAFKDWVDEQGGLEALAAPLR